MYRRVFILLIIVSFNHIAIIPNVIAQYSNAGTIWNIEWSPSEDLLAVAGREGVSIYGHNLDFIYSITSETTDDIAWSPDGTRLAVFQLNNLDNTFAKK